MSRERMPTLREIKEMMTKLLNESRAIRHELKLVKTIVSKGADAILPWMNLSRPMRRQMEATVAYLKAHPDRSEHTYSSVAKVTFDPCPGNFKSDRSLASYLYKIDPDIYV